MEIVLGTHNQKKVLEIARLFDGWPVTFRGLGDFPDSIKVRETGRTFADNARLKGVEQAKVLKRWVLAEDSGLSVAALDGRPGVDSAIFAGPNATDEENNQLLIAQMQSIPLHRRDAWYTCHTVLVDPSARIVCECVGECRGRIVQESRGQSGFGYDPWFEIPEYGMTFAELGMDVKSVLSHRARAMRQLQAQLRQML